MSSARFLVVLLFGLGCASPPETRKVLILGIDGVRPDALDFAETPHLDLLIKKGAFTDRAQALPARETGGDTISGPGWSSMLTGVWADKHGVIDNKFAGKRFQDFPHFFCYLKDDQPAAFTASVATWGPIAEHIVAGADVNVDGESDEDTTTRAIQLLSDERLSALFVHLDDVDGAGHEHGYGPTVSPYLEAVKKADERIGRIVEALRARTTYDREDWLILSCTDHGGRGTGHGNGTDDPLKRTIFFLASGDNATRGRIEGPVHIVDVAATALAHLGVPLDPRWKLDGQPRGLRNDAMKTQPLRP